VSERQLARRLGVSQPAIAKIEAGRVKNLELRTLVRFAAALGARIRIAIEKGQSRGGRWCLRKVGGMAERAAERRATMICPTCAGAKVVRGLGCSPDSGCRPIELACFDCQGTGAIPEERAAWIEEGERLRKDRRGRGLSLREEAKRRRISPVELSAMEHGRVKPTWPT
jgi:transcriptional regulator with XRE-family HTH domain